MATRHRHRKLRKSGKHSRKHQRTFRRKNRVKQRKHSRRRGRVMRGGTTPLTREELDKMDKILTTGQDDYGEYNTLKARYDAHGTIPDMIKRLKNKLVKDYFKVTDKMLQDALIKANYDIDKSYNSFLPP